MTLLKRIRRWRAYRSTRVELERLPTNILNDIGLVRADVLLTSNEAAAARCLRNRGLGF